MKKFAQGFLLALTFASFAAVVSGCANPPPPPHEVVEEAAEDVEDAVD